MIATISVVPLPWEVLRSFQAPGAIVSPPSLKSFSNLGAANCTKLLSGDHILRNVVNSLIVAVVTAAITAFVATLAGYGLGKFKFRGSGIVFSLVLLGFMVPFQAVLVPLFLELHDFHLLNSLAGLALFYTAFTPARYLPDAQHLYADTKRAHRRREGRWRFGGYDADPGAAPVDRSRHRYDRPLRLFVLLDGVPRSADLYDQRFDLYVTCGACERWIYGHLRPDRLWGPRGWGGNRHGAVHYRYVALQRFYVRGLVSGAVKG
jgi:hypothetical protein